MQSVPSLLRGARNFGRGAWSTSGWLTGRGASRLGFRDGLYGFNRFGEGFNSALQNWLKACFVAGTPICTPSGSKPIEEILVGDEVLSRDEFDPAGGVRAKRVLQTFVRVSPVLNLHVRGRVIGTTGEHPFYVEGRGWVAAHSLRIGDTLVSHDGQRVEVEGVADSGRIETVYNFEVADDHTYFVGGPEWGFSVWAHNSDYGVHWTSSKLWERILAAGHLNPSNNSLLWLEYANSLKQLKDILRNGGKLTGAGGTDVAIIVDLARIGPPRIVGSGGQAYLLPEGMRLSGEGGRGLTWWWNTGSSGEIKQIADMIRDLRSTF